MYGLRRPSDQIARDDPRAVVAERVVWRDGAVLVQSQHLAEQAGHRLGHSALGVLADSDVQLAVGTEVDGSAIVDELGPEIREVDQHHLATGDRDVAGRGEPAHSIVR